jgi:hypothetical protein
MSRLHAFLFAGALLAGCVPARVPPNLDDTPGPPVQVIDGTFETPLFAGNYPPGWRTITSPAGEPSFLIFVAPDNCALIQVSALVERAVPDLTGECEGSLRRIDAQAVVGETTVYLSGAALESGGADFEATFEQVTHSLVSPRHRP